MVVPRGREALKGGVKIPAKIEDHLLLKEIVEEDSKGIQPIATEKNEKEKSDQPRQPLSLAFGNDVIDENAGEAGVDQPEQGREKGGTDRPNGKARIFF